MKVFISWSGERSRRIGDIFRQWLPAVIQAVKPYFSPDDIAKGTRWESEIAGELAASRVGLLILTPENIEAPWLMFEAGALSKSIEKSKVCPILFDVQPTDIKGPLVQFQSAKFQIDDIRRVVRMVNGELGDNGLAVDVLDKVFDKWWPNLEADVKNVPSAARKEAERPERDLLQEILSLVRDMSRRETTTVGRPPWNVRALTDLAQSFVRLKTLAKGGSDEKQLAKAIEELEAPIMALVRQRSTKPPPDWVSVLRNTAATVGPESSEPTMEEILAAIRKIMAEE